MPRASLFDQPLDEMLTLHRSDRLLEDARSSRPSRPPRRKGGQRLAASDPLWGLTVLPKWTSPHREPSSCLKWTEVGGRSDHASFSARIPGLPWERRCALSREGGRLPNLYQNLPDPNLDRRSRLQLWQRGFKLGACFQERAGHHFGCSSKSVLQRLHLKLRR